MKKFEYRLLDVNSGFFSAIDYQDLTERLNVLGGQGWEIIAVVETEFTRNQARGLLIPSSAKSSEPAQGGPKKP